MAKRPNRRACGDIRGLLTVLLVGGVVSAAGPKRVSATAGPNSTKQLRPAMRTRVYFGMWSTHLRDVAEGLQNNSLLGIAYHGYYAATFINSFGDRALSAGLQRSFSGGGSGVLSKALGYRAGILTGYDHRFFGLGDKLPAIPFVQLLGNFDFRNAGVEIGYSGIVASVVVNMRLGKR